MSEIVFTMIETNKYSMYEATLNCLERNSDKDTLAPALGEVRETLKGKISDISSTGQRKNAPKGKSDVKDAAHNALVEAAFTVLSALGAFAFKSKNDELKTKVDLSHSDLVRMRDVTLSETAKAALVLGTTYKDADDAKKCGLTSVKLTALETQIATFGTAKQGISEGGTVRSSTVKALEAKFKDVDAYLTNFVDKLIESLKNDAPNFFNEYNAARVIRDLGGSHSSSLSPQMKKKSDGGNENPVAPTQ